MRVVLDTNVLVSALRSRHGASYALISQLPSAQFQIVLTVPLYLEYQDALTRPENMSGKNTREEILAFLRYVCSIAERQAVFFLWRPWLKDQKDDMVLEAAVASNSVYIVTHNLKDFKGIDKFFTVKPVSPGQFLQMMRSRPS
jgi:putative PIN family toxin of toxin-antitoxin system